MGLGERTPLEGGRDVTHRRWNLRRALELAGMLAVFALTLGLATRPLTRPATGQGFPYAYDAALDPRIGEPAPPLAGTDENGKSQQIVPPSDSSPVLLAFLGRCVDCEVGRLANNLRIGSVPRGLRVVALAQGSRRQLGFIKESADLPFEMFLGTPSQATAYNAKWTPRLFLVNGDGSLLYRQPEFIGVQAALWEVENRLSRGPEKEK